MRLIDVSVPLDAQLPTYPHNTPFSLEPIKRIARGDSSNVSTLHMSAHTGTHVDAPRHFFDQGAGTESLALELLIGRARIIEVDSRAGIAAEDLAPLDLSDDIRVLIKTHNSRLWGSPEFHQDYVGVTESGAKYLVEHGIKLVGVDYLSVEKFHNPGAPAHHLLLGAGTIVIEGLNLHDVDPGVYEMFCLPLRVVGSDGAPARVVLRRS
ncbi:MAG TPA: cyclase family protein [Vicinamibacterales bacterium]|nr:cyclase family protein [Vicinamibacterales bacterium]